MPGSAGAPPRQTKPLPTLVAVFPNCAADTTQLQSVMIVNNSRDLPDCEKIAQIKKAHRGKHLWRRVNAKQE
jgi:hypothetical protein